MIQKLVNYSLSFSICYTIRKDELHVRSIFESDQINQRAGAHTPAESFGCLYKMRKAYGVLRMFVKPDLFRERVQIKSVLQKRPSLRNYRVARVLGNERGNIVFRDSLN